jgi:Holliday junction resolvasome RuvABC endonuclease subunit
MILALDPSRILGWTRGEPGGPLAFGHVELVRRGATPGALGFALKEFLNETIMTVDPDLLVYEQPFLPRNFQTGFVLLGMGFLVDTVATEHGVHYFSIIATAATKALTGRAKFPGKDYPERRKAKKLATIEACRARGWDATEDEADAIAVFLLAEAKRFPAAALSRPRVLKQPPGPLFNRTTIGRGSAAARGQPGGR